MVLVDLVKSEIAAKQDEIRFFPLPLCLTRDQFPLIKFSGAGISANHFERKANSV